MPASDHPWSPKASDLLDVLRAQNPWHSTGGQVPEAYAPATERPLAQHLWKQLYPEHARYQFILGPRRVGKTTCMYQTVRHLLGAGVPWNQIWWLRMDHPLLMPRRLGEMVDALLQGGAHSDASPLYLFLDELTYAQDWDLWLKTFFDERYPVRIVGTSSATAALRSRRLESGVGRWEEQYLAPYLLTEFLELRSESAREAWMPPAAATLFETLRELRGPADPELSSLRTQFLLTGGFPELLLAIPGDTAPAGGDGQLRLPLDERARLESNRSALLRSQRVLRSDAVERAVYKDIPQTFGIDNPMLLERLLYTLGSQLTGLLSTRKLGAELGMSQPTCEKYLSYLEQAFLVFTLPNYSGNVAKVRRRGRKLYFTDSAIRNAALQRGLAPLEDAAELGCLLENMVAGHLHALTRHGDYQLYHWRENKREVDFVLVHPDGPLAFEVTGSPRHSTQGLRALIEKHPQVSGRAYLVYPQATTRHPDEQNPIGSLALDQLLCAVGAQVEALQSVRLGI